MKLKIFGEGEEAELEKEVHLRLKHASGNSVIVYACDKEGAPLFCGSLIGFYPDGTMKKMSGINEEIGFQLVDEGCIRERR